MGVLGSLWLLLFNFPNEICLMVLRYLYSPHVQLQEQTEFNTNSLDIMYMYAIRIVFSQHNSLSEIGAKGFFYLVLLC